MFKGGTLIAEAHAMDESSAIALASGFGGVLIGLLKARYIFGHNCRRNLARIAALPDPRPWQCFRPGFLVFLAIIIPTGAMMSRAADGNFVWMCVVGGVDLSLATALFVSSSWFWRTGAFGRAT